MNPENLSLAVAFCAGHLAGRTLDKDGGSRAMTLAHALAFVLGFTVIFVSLGASVGLMGYLFQDAIKSLTFRVIAGAVLVVMGLHTMGVLRVGALDRQTRITARPDRRLGFLASFLVGVIFAAGWTPCIGPILGTILVYAGTQGTV